MLITVLFTCGVMLMACSDNSQNTKSDQNNQGNTVDNKQQNDNDEQKGENDNDISSNDQENERSNKWGDDELGLGIGDTGTLHNNFSKSEITLDSVEVVNDDGYEKAYYGQYIVVHLTVKNIGEEAVDPLSILDVTHLALDDDLGGDSWDEYGELSEGWPEKIGVGEEASGPLVFDAEDADEYELQIDFNLASISNKVSFIFDDGDID